MKRAEVIWDLVRGLHQGQQHQLRQQAGHMDAPDQSSEPISSLHRKGRPHMVTHAEGSKRFRHPGLGPLELEFSTFAVDGRSELGMVVYTTASEVAADRVRRYLEERRRA